MENKVKNFFCSNCFNDIEIKSMIEQSDGSNGNCDFCKSENVKLVDINNNNELFNDIVSNFNDLADVFDTDLKTDEEGYSLSSFLQENTDIFSDKLKVHATSIDSLLYCIYKGDYKNYASKQVIPIYYRDDKNRKNLGVFKGNNWKQFEEDIKHNHRFFSRNVNIGILDEFLKSCIISIKKGSYYRARICNGNNTFGPKDMGAAPKNKSSAGRLNARGIGYLYLSENYETSIKEIRATINDVCTVANFKIKDNLELTLVDLSKVSKISPFGEQDKEKVIENYQVFVDMDNAMRKLVNKNLSDVDYAPTEYISDVIKSLRYSDSEGFKSIDGIKYKSTLDDVYDIVLFNDYKNSSSKVIQVESNLTNYRISNIDYKIEKYNN